MNRSHRHLVLTGQWRVWWDWLVLSGREFLPLCPGTHWDWLCAHTSVRACGGQRWCSAGSWDSATLAGQPWALGSLVFCPKALGLQSHAHTLYWCWVLNSHPNAYRSQLSCLFSFSGVVLRGRRLSRWGAVKGSGWGGRACRLACLWAQLGSRFCRSSWGGIRPQRGTWLSGDSEQWGTWEGEKAVRTALTLSLSWDSPLSSWQTFVWMPSLSPLPSSHPRFLLPLCFTRLDTAEVGLLFSLCCFSSSLTSPWLSSSAGRGAAPWWELWALAADGWSASLPLLGLCDPRSVLVSSGSYKMGEGPRLRWGWSILGDISYLGGHSRCLPGYHN